MKKVKTLYEYFPDYTEEDVNRVINKLNPKAKEILKLKFGFDYKKINDQIELSKKELFFFNNILKLVIKKLRENEKSKKTLYEYFPNSSKAEIDLGVLDLTEKAKNILYKRYKESLDIPSDYGNFTHREAIYFWNNVIVQINLNIEKERMKINNSESLYEYFKKYPKHKIDELVYFLQTPEKVILKTKYGDTYENNNHNNLSIQQLNLLYKTLHQMKYKLKNGFYDIRILYEYFPNYSKDIIDKAVMKLSKKASEIINRVYPNGYLNVGDCSCLSPMESHYFYNQVLEMISDKLKKIKTGSTIYKSIYEYFLEYKESEVDKAIDSLTLSQKEMLIKKYGNDLKNPVYTNHITNEDEIYLGTNVRKRIKRIMDKNREKDLIKEKTLFEYFPDYTKDEIKKACFLLKDNHKEILYLKYGYDLLNPKLIKTLSKENEVKFKYILKSLEKTLLQIRNKEAIISFNKTVYDYFPKFSEEEIDEAILTLPKKALEILKKKYGSDLKNPQVIYPLDSKDSAYFSSNLLVTLRKRLISKQEGLDVITGRPPKSIYEYFKNNKVEEVDEIIASLSKRAQDILILRYGTDFQNPKANILTSDDKVYFRYVLANMRARLNQNELIKKQNQSKILMFLKQILHYQLISNFNQKEIEIILLYFVYHYDILQLSNSFSYSEEKIKTIINKFLILYQDKTIKDIILSKKTI